MFVRQHWYSTKFHYDSAWDSNKIKQKCNLHYTVNVYDDIRDFEICGFRKNTKI